MALGDCLPEELVGLLTQSALGPWTGLCRGTAGPGSAFRGAACREAARRSRAGERGVVSWARLQGVLHLILGAPLTVSGEATLPSLLFSVHPLPADASC